MAGWSRDTLLYMLGAPMVLDIRRRRQEREAAVREEERKCLPSV